MRGRLVLVVMALLLSSSLPSTATIGPSGSASSSEEQSSQKPETLLQFPNPWVDDSLLSRVDSGQETVWVTAITSSLAHLDSWQRKTGSIERQAPPGPGESMSQSDEISMGIDHRTFWVNSSLLQKLDSVHGLSLIHI